MVARRATEDPRADRARTGRVPVVVRSGEGILAAVPAEAPALR